MFIFSKDQKGYKKIITQNMLDCIVPTAAQRQELKTQKKKFKPIKFSMNKRYFF